MGALQTDRAPFARRKGKMPPQHALVAVWKPVRREQAVVPRRSGECQAVRCGPEQVRTVRRQGRKGKVHAADPFFARGADQNDRSARVAALRALPDAVLPIFGRTVLRRKPSRDAERAAERRKQDALCLRRGLPQRQRRQWGRAERGRSDRLHEPCPERRRIPAEHSAPFLRKICSQLPPLRQKLLISDARTEHKGRPDAFRHAVRPGRVRPCIAQDVRRDIEQVLR